MVVVCTDTDCYDTDCMQKEDNEKINAFCQAHQYKYIWFCRKIVGKKSLLKLYHTKYT